MGDPRKSGIHQFINGRLVELEPEEAAQHLKDVKASPNEIKEAYERYAPAQTEER